ncbi:MAG: undecaprenyldiphospho-muramoylpentapeptide beta-N-acetylglucosaminyltransferase [Cyanobacteria bacterium P01_H01_bin.15]
MASTSNPRLLIAASGTGGHLFPALAVAQQLTDYRIDWLGVPDRLEHKLVPQDYPLHIVNFEGLQTRPNLKTLIIFWRFLVAIWQVRSLLKQGEFAAVFTTGGYIAGPAIWGAKLAGIPVILHESNLMPGKITRWFGAQCQTVAIGFPGSSRFLPRSQTTWVGTPVRQEFHDPRLLTLPIPPEAPLIVIAGGSQGAVSVNRLVRSAASDWFEAGAYVVHLTGDRDPDAESLIHPQYFRLAFFDNMPALLARATLAVSRAGAGTITELAFTQTPAILIPYPYAADDHQSYNAQAMVDAGAALLFPQSELTSPILSKTVLDLLAQPTQLEAMAKACDQIAVKDSAEQLAYLVRQSVTGTH